MQKHYIKAEKGLLVRAFSPPNDQTDIRYKRNLAGGSGSVTRTTLTVPYTGPERDNAGRGGS